MSVSGGFLTDNISLYVFGQYLPPGLRPSLVVKKAWVTYSIGGSLNALSVLLHLYGLRYGDLTIVIPLIPPPRPCGRCCSRPYFAQAGRRPGAQPVCGHFDHERLGRKIERITWPILLGTLAVVVGGALVAGRAL